MSKLWDRQGRQVQPRRICRQFHRRKVPCLGSRGVWSGQSRDGLVWAKRKSTISPTFDFNVKIIIIMLYEGWGWGGTIFSFFSRRALYENMGNLSNIESKIFRLFKINSLWPKISYLDFEGRSDAIGQIVDHTASLKKKKYSLPTWKAHVFKITCMHMNISDSFLGVFFCKSVTEFQIFQKFKRCSVW